MSRYQEEFRASYELTATGRCFTFKTPLGLIYIQKQDLIQNDFGSHGVTNIVK